MTKYGLYGIISVATAQTDRLLVDTPDNTVCRWGQFSLRNKRHGKFAVMEHIKEDVTQDKLVTVPCRYSDREVTFECNYNGKLELYGSEQCISAVEARIAKVLFGKYPLDHGAIALNKFKEVATKTLGEGWIAQADIDSTDANRDGRITISEYSDYIQRRTCKERAREMFHLFAEGDKINVEAYKQMISISWFVSILEEVNEDGDGNELSVEELKPWGMAQFEDVDGNGTMSWEEWSDRFSRTGNFDGLDPASIFETLTGDVNGWMTKEDFLSNYNLC